MAKFYGTIQGNRGKATKTGSRASGFRASCQSWDGSIIVTVREDKDGETRLNISFSEYSESYGGRTIIDASVDELREMVKAYNAK